MFLHFWQMIQSWEEIHQNHLTYPTALKKNHIFIGAWPSLSSLILLSPNSSSHQFPGAAGVFLDFIQIPLVY